VSVPWIPCGSLIGQLDSPQFKETGSITPLSCGTCSPSPSVTSISHSSATAGGSQFLLTVNGDDFRHDSVVNWNGSFVVTTFVSTHQLSAVITPANMAQPGTVEIFVFNPPEGGTTFVSGGLRL